MRFIFLLAIVGGVTLFAPSRPKAPSLVLSVGAQEKHGSISGVVTGPDSMTIVAARITAMSQTSAGAAASPLAYTDQSGGFRFDSLPEGKYELQVETERTLLLKQFTTSVTVRDAEKTNVDIRLQTIEQCNGEKLDHLTSADKDEIIKLMLEEALTRKGIPSYVNLVVGNEALLSMVNIESQRISNPAGLKLVLLSPGEIQARANRQGDLMYLEFGKFEPHGSCVAISLSNLWADGTSTIETGPKSRLGEGGLYYIFYKRSGKWVGEFVSGWIS